MRLVNHLSGGVSGVTRRLLSIQNQNTTKVMTTLKCVYLIVFYLSS